MGNQRTHPWGVKGGRAGRPGRIVVNPGEPGERIIPGFAEGVILARGDLLRFTTCGGGGYGDPAEREPERVLDDVADGFVTAQAAREDYGVVLDASGLRLDQAATARVRSGPRPVAALFDRGPQFDRLEHERERSRQSPICAGCVVAWSSSPAAPPARPSISTTPIHRTRSRLH